MFFVTDGDDYDYAKIIDFWLFIDVCQIEDQIARKVTEIIGGNSCKSNLKIKKHDQQIGYGENRMTAEEYLKECKRKVCSQEFCTAVDAFKAALGSQGDQACFFFEDIVRLLIKRQSVGFKLNELYEDYGITDKAKRELLAVSSEDFIAAFRTYASQKQSSNVLKTEVE